MKPKFSATTNLEFFGAVFEVSKKFAEGSSSPLGHYSVLYYFQGDLSQQPRGSNPFIAISDA